MGIKDQLTKIKDNWLLIAIVLLILFFSASGGCLSSLSTLGGGLSMNEAANAATSKGYGGSGVADRSYIPVPSSEGFAPEVKERKIAHTTQMSNEVERGKFYESENTLKSIVQSSDAFLLNQNVYKQGTDRKSYLTGSYEIKVDTKKYDSLVAQLKGIGEVQSFNDQQEDITGVYTDTKLEIEAENERLKRYQSMYGEATLVADKITINDRIFDQEMRIKYMEKAVEEMDQRIDYSTVYITITEKKSEYADVAFVKLSELIKYLVGSSKAFVSFVFVIIPWAAGIFIIWLAVRLIRRRK